MCPRFILAGASISYGLLWNIHLRCLSFNLSLCLHVYVCVFKWFFRYLKFAGDEI